MNQYGIKKLDSGQWALYRVPRWSPTWKAKFVRYILSGLECRYRNMRDMAPIGSDLHIFKEGK